MTSYAWFQTLDRPLTKGSNTYVTDTFMGRLKIVRNRKTLLQTLFEIEQNNLD